MQVDTVLSRLTALRERIEGTEALIEIDLDHRRNELVAFDLVRSHSNTVRSHSNTALLVLLSVHALCACCLCMQSVHAVCECSAIWLHVHWNDTPCGSEIVAK